MTKGIFVTGTGTDIGKTYVTGLLVKKLRQSGINAGYYKAALSGAERIDGKLVPGDAKFVCDMAGLNEEPSHLVSYLYEEAVSPHLAAHRAGESIEKIKIQKDYQRVQSHYEYVVVEGSGGIICPLNMDCVKPLMLEDIVKLLNLEVLLIADAGLGTINTTFLTVDYLKKRQLTIRGIILNNYQTNNFMHEDNKKQIERLTGVPIIACVEKNKIDISLNTHLLL